MTGIEDQFAAPLEQRGELVVRLTRPRKGAALASFPVKHHWHERADPELIRRSAEQFVALADKFGYERVVMPRLGSGNGGLPWREVRPLLEEVLDKRFTVVTFPKGSPGSRDT